MEKPPLQPARAVAREAAPDTVSGRHTESNRLRRVLLVSGDERFCAELGGQLSQFGFDVTSCRQVPGANDFVADERPDAFIVDIDTLEADTRSVLRALDGGGAQAPAAVVLSRDTGIAPRLAAVRAGASAYLAKPLELTRLLDILEALTTDLQTEPYRILIVDDSAQLAALHAHQLDAAGMRTRVVTDPTQVIATIDDFNPELILMGVHMPKVSGPELAAVIRQYDNYIGTPIVFLSTETDKEQQLLALGRGGDDFLTMPIEPEHLVAAVRTRAERYRALRSFMVRDSLTGLLNHTNLKERLDGELARAARHHAPLSFAMIDLDHFKRVNDRYGHPTGDRVLKSLARLIRQRLRRTDIVGRYGGEEFAVILPDTDLATALGILEDLRADFAEVRHSADGGEFQITFSCGIAGFPAYRNAVALNDAADKALYDAKHAGRNRVALAE